MSQRAAANIQDEMEVLGPLRLTEVQEAQKAIINVARTMSDEGTIVLAGVEAMTTYDIRNNRKIAQDNNHTDEILSIVKKIKKI